MAMRNPLHRRLGRQLRHETGRYLGTFLLLVVTVGVVSGFLATLSSIQRIVDGMDGRYSVEDARFETSEPLGDDARSAAEKGGATIYDNWSHDATATVDGNDVTIRAYRNRTKVDLPSYYEGRPPKADDEIALDDTFCELHGLEVGDTIEVGGRDLTVCGVMVLSDYTTLMRSNTDIVMNTTTFSVALVSDEGFELLSDFPISYTYSVLFDDDTLSTAERTERETNMATTLEDAGASLTELLDRDQNQGINYLGNDMQGDGAMFMGFFYILVAVMAFVFVILTNATIEQEASAIGTLRASGWRKGEIVRHYLTLPALVGVASIVMGNVLGYTVFSQMAQHMYYSAYSLPPYHTTFDVRIFVLTSIVPLVMLVGITLVGLVRKLGATPLAFLRHEVSRGKRRHNVHLPERLGYVARFRLRVLLRNIPTFATLLAGVLLGSVLLMFSLTILPTFSDYADHTATSMPTRHIYTLKAPYELQMTSRQQDLRDQLARLFGAGLGDMAQDLAAQLHPVADDGAFTQEQVDQAEKLCLSTLQTRRRLDGGMEDVSVYGIEDDSRYWKDVDASDGRVLVGEGLLDKCDLEVGDPIVLYDKYADKSYALAIDGTTGDYANTNVYMGQDAFNDTFGHEADWFDAYASDEELDIDADYLASTLTPTDMKDLADEMLGMFTDAVQLIVWAATLIFFVVMYLLTKTVLDHSARAISYMKVFGYRDREVRGLYLRSITIAVALSLVVGLPVTMWLVSALMKVMLATYPGNFVVPYPPTVIVRELAIEFSTYVVVALLHMRRIRRVPLQLALKAQE